MMNSSKCTYFHIIFLLVLHFSACMGKPKRPHVVFILADDYGFNDVGYHGSEIKTPNLNQLSAKGVRLENYYVQPICTPTRAQLLSGRYQIHIGLQHDIIYPPQPNCLPVKDKTVAQALKEIGYSTHIVGKWHLGFYKKECWPTQRGFDTFFGFFLGQGDYYTRNRAGCGFPGIANCSEWIGHDLRRNEDVTYDYGDMYSTHMYTMEVQRLLRNHVRNKVNRNKPLFMYVPYQAVHSPLTVPETYIEPYSFIKDENRRIYAGMVAAMDEGIGNITDTLKELGMWEDTVLIFSSDNGGHVSEGGNNWPLRGWKKMLWEGGVRGVGFLTSPLLPPEIIGTIYKGLMHVSDWFPTIVEGLVGGSVEGLKLDGHNIWKALRTGKKSPRKELLHNIDPLWPPPESDRLEWPLAEFNAVEYYRRKSFSTDMRAAIRVGDWKLITGDPSRGDPSGNRWVPVPDSPIVPPMPTDPPGKRLWLFNIAEDPNEYHDLSDSHPTVVKLLFERLEHYYNTAVPVKYPPGDPKADPAFHNGVWTNWGDDEANCTVNDLFFDLIDDDDSYNY